MNAMLDNFKFYEISRNITAWCFCCRATSFEVHQKFEPVSTKLLLNEAAKRQSFPDKLSPPYHFPKSHVVKLGLSNTGMELGGVRICLYLLMGQAKLSIQIQSKGLFRNSHLFLPVSIYQIEFPFFPLF